MLLSQVAINIFRVGSIIRVQFSGWQLFGGTYQQSIILRGNSLSANCPRANYLGDNFRRSNFRGSIIRGAIILEGNCPGGNDPGGQLSCSHITLKRCFNMKSSTYCFHMKTKILAKFQICISRTLRNVKVQDKKKNESFQNKHFKFLSKYFAENGKEKLFLNDPSCISNLINAKTNTFLTIQIQ